MNIIKAIMVIIIMIILFLGGIAIYNFASDHNDNIVVCNKYTNSNYDSKEIRLLNEECH